jgi:hypothetical protein
LTGDSNLASSVRYSLSTQVGQLSAPGKNRVFIVSHTSHFLSVCDSSTYSSFKFGRRVRSWAPRDPRICFSGTPISPVITGAILKILNSTPNYPRDCG